jgi:cytochrome c biogenesis protein CcmG, thiol:disulfide interchange protein DsbE
MSPDGPELGSSAAGGRRQRHPSTQSRDGGRRRRRRVVVLAGVVAAVALLTSLFAFGLSHDPTVLTSPLIGRVAPAFSLRRLDGSGTVRLSELRGQVVVVNFWASWCPPCVKELPLLERAQRELTRRDATVLGINIQDATEDALKYVRRFDLTYPSVRDVDRTFARRYGTNAYPETFVIDRRGRISALHRGPIDQRWLKHNVEPLL